MKFDQAAFLAFLATIRRSIPMVWSLSLGPQRVMRLRMPCIVATFHRLVRSGGDLDEGDGASFVSSVVKVEDVGDSDSSGGDAAAIQRSAAASRSGAAAKRARDLEGNQKEVRSPHSSIVLLCTPSSAVACELRDFVQVACTFRLKSWEFSRTATSWTKRGHRRPPFS